VFLLYAASLLAWHVPGPYDAAVHHQALHALEHLTFLGTAVLLWMVLLRERPQVPAGMAIGLAMATWVVTASLGALLTFAGAPLYPVYAHATSAWGLSPLRDQRMAGLIMWAPTGLAYIAAAGWRLLRLLAEPDAEGTPPARRTAGTLAGTKGGA
jgi:putative membrane protein